MKKISKHVGKFQSHPQDVVFVTKSAVTHLSDLGNFLLRFWLWLSSSFKWEQSIIVLFSGLLGFPGSVFLWRRTLGSFERNESFYCFFFLVLYFLPLQRQVQGLILYRLIVEASLTHVVRLGCFWELRRSQLTQPRGGFSSWQPVVILVPGDSRDLPPVSGPLCLAQSDSMSGWRPL